MATYRVPVLKDFSWQPPVADKDLTDPPGGEAKGDRYIVASAGAGGAWTGLENHVVTYDGAAWLDDTPTEGWTVWVLDEDCYYHYTGAGAWDKDDVDQMASAILSIEVLASDTLESLHAYESALSNETSVVKSSYLSDLASAISDIDSAIAAETASLATAISTVDDRVDTNVAAISTTSNLAESNQDSINLLYSSLHAYESALSDKTSAVSAAAHDEFQTNSNLISNISNALSAVSDIVAAINVSALSNLAESCQDSINLLYSSLHTYESALSDATSAVKESLLSDLASAISNISSIADVATASLATALASVESTLSSVIASVETELSDATSEVKASAAVDWATNSNLISNISNALSAVSNLATSAQAVGSYIAAYGAIEFTI